jgi:hypothetical protein
MKYSAIAGAGALVALIAVGQAAFADVGVTVNGDSVAFNPPPIVQGGRVFVPLRGVFERLGASVVYNDGNIDAQGSGRDISLHIDSTSATINGQPEILDVAPFIVGASTYVPLRFVSEALGASVNYDDSDSVVSITTAGYTPQYVAPAAATIDNDGGYASYAPPPIPSYAQPELAVPDEIWQPGYWAWGPYGYFWVPGTWVEPPQTGYYWTPGYWRANNTSYAWSPGFWAIAVGFYGGVNYGYGYGGHGYDGGRWHGRRFEYNTYVTHVNTRIVRNVYVNKTIIVNNDTTRVSYNGGAHGVQAKPSTRELQVSHQSHINVTPAQLQHLRVAEQDRNMLATVNHDRPPVVAVARPLTVTNKPAQFEPVKPVVHPAPKYHAAPTAPIVNGPGSRPLPIVRTVPVVRPPSAVKPEYRAPAAAPAYHAPIVRAPQIVQPARVIPPPPRIVPAFRPQSVAAPIVRSPQRPVAPAVSRPARQAGDHRR